MPSSKSKKRERQSPRTHTPSQGQAPRCGHVGTYSWDNHQDCTSCQVWNKRGGMSVKTDLGVVQLPCVFEPFCQVCEAWSPETRECYLKAIIERVINPGNFKKGAKFLKENGFSAPLELMSLLGMDIVSNQEQQLQGKNLFDSFQNPKARDNTPTESDDSDDEKIPHSQTVSEGLEPGNLEGSGQGTGELPPPSGGSITSVLSAGRAASKRGHSRGSLLGTGQMTGDFKQFESEILGGLAGNSGGTCLTGALGGLDTPGGTGTRGDTGSSGNPGTHGSPMDMDTMQGTGAYGYPGGVGSGDLSGQNIPGLGPGHFLAAEEVVGSGQGSTPGISYLDWEPTLRGGLKIILVAPPLQQGTPYLL